MEVPTNPPAPPTDPTGVSPEVSPSVSRVSPEVSPVGKAWDEWEAHVKKKQPNLGEPPLPSSTTLDDLAEHHGRIKELKTVHVDVLLAWCSNSGCTGTFKTKGKRTKGFTVGGTIAEKRSRLMLFYTNYNANKAMKEKEEKDAAAIRDQLQQKEAEQKAKQALNMNEWLLLFMIITTKEDPGVVADMKKVVEASENREEIDANERMNMVAFIAKYWTREHCIVHRDVPDIIPRSIFPDLDPKGNDDGEINWDRLPKTIFSFYNKLRSALTVMVNNYTASGQGDSDPWDYCDPFKTGKKQENILLAYLFYNAGYLDFAMRTLEGQSIEAGLGGSPLSQPVISSSSSQRSASSESSWSSRIKRKRSPSTGIDFDALGRAMRPEKSPIELDLMKSQADLARAAAASEDRKALAEAAAARAGRYTVLLGHLKDLTDQRENARRKGDEKLIEFLGFQLDCIQAKIKDAMEDM